VGVVKSLALIGAGPVGLVHRQKVRFFQKKNPTSSGEGVSYPCIFFSRI